MLEQRESVAILKPPYLWSGYAAEPPKHGAHPHPGAPDLGRVQLRGELVDYGEAGRRAELSEEHEERAEVPLRDEAGGGAEHAEEGHGEHHEGLPTHAVHGQGADDAGRDLCPSNGVQG